MKEKLKIILIFILAILLLFPNIQYGSIEYKSKTDYEPQPSPDIPNWYFKPSYKNSTWGPPDFDQRQDNWHAIGPLFFQQYSYDGPTALLNCLWWMDCKYGNNTETYMLPNFFSAGNGSKDPRNVIPTVDWLAVLLNTSVPGVVPTEHYGTSAENMTQGITNVLEYANATEMVDVCVEGYAESCYGIQGVNYSNITYHLAQCDDVILLLGMYTWDPVFGFGPRIGGHYVQVCGYNTSQAQLAFADPFYDMGEIGVGWASTHDHLLYGNGSHNWTQNVSYDFYIMNITSNFGGGAACEVINYPADDNVTNWSYLNWAADCIQMSPPFLAYKTVVECAWYLSLNKSVSVEKQVWNGTQWSKYYNAPAGTEMKFNITIQNTGDNWANDNLTVYETFYDCLRYVNHSGNITFSKNGTTYHRDADKDTWEAESCSYPGHGHLIWEIPGSEIGENFTMGDKIWIEFNMTTNCSNYSTDWARAYICEFGFEWWDSLHYSNISYCYVGSQFNTSIDCPECRNETSAWVVSEHVHRAGKETCLDDKWFEYETDFDKWMPINSSYYDDPAWDWVYRYDDTDGEGLDHNNLSYTIANNSGINRSLDFARMRYNVTNTFSEGEEPSVGIIYSFHNNSYFDMVLYSYVSLFLLSVDNDILVNTVDRTPVLRESDAINYYNSYWCWNSSYSGYVDPYQESGVGIYAKTLYSEVTGELKTKAWSPSSAYVEEPPGWIYQDQIPYIVYNGSKCFGLVVWDTWGNNFTADFDLINDWRLNHTLNNTLDGNQTTYMNESGIPFMHIKATNKSSWENEYNGFMAEFMCYWFAMPEPMTLIDFVDIGYRRFMNISNQFNMESKLSHPPNVINDTFNMDNQNDTIYYYAGLQTGVEMMPYKNQLVFHIEDTTDGVLDIGDACVLAIDVDNNHTLDDNDLTVVWWWDLWRTSYTMYYGTTPVAVWQDGNIGWGNSWFYTTFANSSIRWMWDYYGYIPILHRLSPHRIYECVIPLNLLEKFGTGSKQYLNENDTFGLHLMTVPYNHSIDDIAVVWENYNETTDDVLIPGTEDENWYSTWGYYLNLSTSWNVSDFIYNGIWDGCNATHMQYWGHGRLGDEQGYVQETSWETLMTKWANVSIITNTAINNTVNYTINITNTGEQPIGNVTVNESFPAGVWYVGSTLPIANVTCPYDNFYRFNVTWDLAITETVSFNITVNISENWGGNGSYVWNFANETNNNSANASANVSIKYGTNTAPRINWQYPIYGNTSTPITLINISVNVTDAEADMLNISFYTNKSIDDSWTPAWNCIGQNLSVYNGTYMSNQTFNNSDRHNTRWRWGASYYYWSVNVTDGKTWTNESYYFKTAESRYDVYFDHTVNVFDLNVDWTYRTASGYSYLGIYDTYPDDTINVFDLNIIWTNKS